MAGSALIRFHSFFIITLAFPIGMIILHALMNCLRFLFLLLLASHCGAQEEKRFDPFSQGDPLPEAPFPVPDDLMPADGGTEDPGGPDEAGDQTYRAKFKELMKLGDFAFARMIICGDYSFNGDDVISIHGGAEDRDPETTGQFFLTLRSSNKTIYNTVTGRTDGQARLELHVTSITVPLEKPLALRLIRLWTCMVGRAKPPERYPTINDGNVYRFSVPGKAGIAISPDWRRGSGILMNIGNKLRAYGKASETDRPAIEKEIERGAAWLEKYLAEHPEKK